VSHSVLSGDVVVEAGAHVEGSVLMPGVRVGKGAIVRRAILDKNVVIPDGAQVGMDPGLDRERYTVSGGGVVVLGKGAHAE
jgi:glucose-1-phosphate adenylyltransferase